MCERAREWASLRLDDELSELERVLLDAHVSRCAACAAYVVEIGAITEEIRATEPEAPSEPISLPLRRRIAFATRALQAGAAMAAVIAVTVGLSIEVGSRTPAASRFVGTQLPLSEVTSGPNSENDLLLRLPQLVNLKQKFGFGRPGGLQIDT